MPPRALSLGPKPIGANLLESNSTSDRHTAAVVLVAQFGLTTGMDKVGAGTDDVDGCDNPDADPRESHSGTAGWKP